MCVLVCPALIHADSLYNTLDPRFYLNADHRSVCICKVSTAQYDVQFITYSTCKQHLIGYALVFTIGTSRASNSSTNIRYTVYCILNCSVKMQYTGIDSLQKFCNKPSLEFPLFLSMCSLVRALDPSKALFFDCPADRSRALFFRRVINPNMAYTTLNCLYNVLNRPI